MLHVLLPACARASACAGSTRWPRPTGTSPRPLRPARIARPRAFTQVYMDSQLPPSGSGILLPPGGSARLVPVCSRVDVRRHLCLDDKNRGGARWTSEVEEPFSNNLNLWGSRTLGNEKWEDIMSGPIVAIWSRRTSLFEPWSCALHGPVLLTVHGHSCWEDLYGRIPDDGADDHMFFPIEVFIKLDEAMAAFEAFALLGADPALTRDQARAAEHGLIHRLRRCAPFKEDTFLRIARMHHVAALDWDASQAEERAARARQDLAAMGPVEECHCQIRMRTRQWGPKKGPCFCVFRSVPFKE